MLRERGFKGEEVRSVRQVFTLGAMCIVRNRQRTICLSRGSIRRATVTRMVLGQDHGAEAVHCGARLLGTDIRMPLSACALHCRTDMTAELWPLTSCSGHGKDKEQTKLTEQRTNSVSPLSHHVPHEDSLLHVPVQYICTVWRWCVCDLRKNNFAQLGGFSPNCCHHGNSDNLAQIPDHAATQQS